MPNCFRLYPKGSSEAVPLNTVVDPAIAAYLNIPCDPKLWTADWFHVIGFLIACKNDCDLGSVELERQICKWYDDDDSIYRLQVKNGKMTEDERVSCRETMFEILRFLEQRYTSDAWAEIGRRA